MSRRREGWPPRQLPWGCALLFSLAALAMAAPSFAGPEPRLSWNLYGDVGFTATTGPEPATFVASGLDAFVKADLTPKLGFVGELFFGITPHESFQENGGRPAAGFTSTVSVVDAPRFYASFRPARWLEVRVGRDFTPIGYYQTAYPYTGQALQLASDRPEILGILAGGEGASAELGLSVRGAFDLGRALTIEYAVGVGNGAYHHGVDLNRQKSVVGRLAFQPLALEGLEIGVSAYYDKVAPFGSLATEAELVLLAAHLVYIRYPIEFMAEYYGLTHRPLVPGARKYRLDGGFAQLGWELGRWTPFVRWERTSRDVDDPVLNALGAPAEVHQLSVGLRVRLHEKMVLKVEYHQHLFEEFKAGIVQAAFAY